MFTELPKYPARSQDLKTLIQPSIGRHVFLGAGQRGPSLKVAPQSVGILVMGENAPVTKITPIFMQYWRGLRLCSFLPKQMKDSTTAAGTSQSCWNVKKPN